VPEPSPCSQVVVRPSGPLRGVVRAGGAKNSALKLMAACLLAEGRFVLRNVPRITDVGLMAEVLRAMGAEVVRQEPSGPDDPGDLVVTVPAALEPVAPMSLVAKMRASIVVLGPLLARCGWAVVGMPGGDDFGERPIDLHLEGLAAMGARFETAEGGGVAGTVPGRRLQGTTIRLAYPSHTVTDNLLMAATLAEGTTVIENAAREPEVQDLAAFLEAMGAEVRGAGTSRVVVRGALALQGASHRVVPDRVVTATFLAAVGMAGGEVRVADGHLAHMEMLVRKLRAMGLEVEGDAEGIWAAGRRRLRSVDVSTLPYPGVATDYKPFIVAMLSVAEGVGIVTENLFSGRFRYVEELRRMGADVRIEGHHAVVRGVPRLQGARVRATDLRAGAALVLAGLVAEGQTVVLDAQHVDRGYDDLVGKLRSLGAPVWREHPEGELAVAEAGW
jgi:UDP-N-acetylglucosamine 1-carboxyvinyltransferase